MQRTEITEAKIKEYAVEGVIAIGMYTSVSGCALYFIFWNILHIFESVLLTALISFGGAFCVVGYILLNKFFIALSCDVTARGLSDGIKQKNRQ